MGGPAAELLLCRIQSKKSHLPLSVLQRGGGGGGGAETAENNTCRENLLSLPRKSSLLLQFTKLSCPAFLSSFHSPSSLLLFYSLPQPIFPPLIIPLPTACHPCTAPLSSATAYDSCFRLSSLFLSVFFRRMSSQLLSFPALIFPVPQPVLLCSCLCSSHSLTSLLYLPSSLSLSSLLLSFLLHQPVFLAHIFPPLKAYLPCFYLSSANSLSFPALTYIYPPTAYPPWSFFFLLPQPSFPAQPICSAIEIPPSRAYLPTSQLLFFSSSHSLSSKLPSLYSNYLAVQLITKIFFPDLCRYSFYQGTPNMWS